MGALVLAETSDLPMPMRQPFNAPMWVLRCLSNECRISVFRPVALKHMMLHASAATH